MEIKKMSVNIERSSIFLLRGKTRICCTRDIELERLLGVSERWGNASDVRFPNVMNMYELSGWYEKSLR